MREAVARAGGDLEEAERMAAEARLQMEIVAEDGPGCSSSQPRPSKRTRRLEDDAVIVAIQERFAVATAELTALKEAMTSTEPDNERTAFLGWTKKVYLAATDEQFFEYMTMFMAMATGGSHRSSSSSNATHAPATAVSSASPPASTATTTTAAPADAAHTAAADATSLDATTSTATACPACPEVLYRIGPTYFISAGGL